MPTSGVGSSAMSICTSIHILNTNEIDESNDTTTEATRVEEGRRAAVGGNCADPDVPRGTAGLKARNAGESVGDGGRATTG